MLFDLTKTLLKSHEGVERYPYRDTKGKLTIGVGFNLDDTGLYPEEIDYILDNRLRIFERDLRRLFPQYKYVGTARKAALLDMTYNMGIPRISKFKRMWKAIKDKDFEAAAEEMKDSKWYRQDVPKWRSEKLIEMMRTGEIGQDENL